MRIGTKLLAVAAGIALFAGGAIAQTTTGGATPRQNTSPNAGVSVGATGGVTSGPAATGQPATLGTGGTTATTPHQTEAIRNSGGEPIRAEKRGQHGGTRRAVKPSKSDAGAGVHKPQQ